MNARRAEVAADENVWALRINVVRRIWKQEHGKEYGMNTTTTTPTMPMCTEIALREDGDLDFHRFGEIMAFASFCEKAGYLPKNTTREQATLAIVAGKQLGLAPFAAIQNIAVINGRPSVWGDAVGGLVASSGLCEREYVEEIGTEKDFRIVYHVKRKGREDEVVREFGYADAVRAQLWGKAGPWTSYPKRMMMMRARAFAYRDAFPDVLKGMRIAEEEQDVIDVEPVGNEKLSLPENGLRQPVRRLRAGRVRAGNLMQMAAVKCDVDSEACEDKATADENQGNALADNQGERR